MKQTTMRIRVLHATALALVGWYLLVPPPGSFVRGKPEWNDRAPLPKWFYYNELSTWTPMDRAHALEFKSKEECDSKKRQKWPENPPSLAHSGGDIQARLENYRIMGAKTVCVATNDPRLKSN